jgi:glutaredoxin 3
MEPRITIYRTRFCPYCTMAARLLDGRGAAYHEEFLDANPQRRAQLQAETQHMTVPMIFIDARFIGGYRELAALDRSGDLDRILRGAA